MCIAPDVIQPEATARSSMMQARSGAPRSPPTLETTVDTATAAEHAVDFRIVNARTLGGANIWHLGPAVVAELRVGQLGDVTPAETPELMGRLRAALPGAFQGALNEASEHSWGDVL